MTSKHIVSPLPGTFYRRSAPDQPEYKVEGDRVRIGDVVGLVDVMKLFHEVKSDLSGTVVKVLIENEDTVVAGQPLFEIDE